MTVQKLYKGNHSSRDPTSSQHWFSYLASTDMSCWQAKCIFFIVEQHYLDVNPTWNVRMVLEVPSKITWWTKTKYL